MERDPVTEYRTGIIAGILQAAAALAIVTGIAWGTSAEFRKILRGEELSPKPAEKAPGNEERQTR